MQAARKTGVFVTTIVLEENKSERKRAKGRIIGEDSEESYF